MIEKSKRQEVAKEKRVPVRFIFTHWKWRNHSHVCVNPSRSHSMRKQSSNSMIAHFRSRLPDSLTALSSAWYNRPYVAGCNGRLQPFHHINMFIVANSTLSSRSTNLWIFSGTMSSFLANSLESCLVLIDLDKHIMVVVVTCCRATSLSMMLRRAHWFWDVARPLLVTTPANWS